MESYLFRGIEAAPDTLIVEGWHKPGSLTVASGAWISTAGNAVLESGTYTLIPHEQYVWFCVENGKANLRWNSTELNLSENDTFILPAGPTSGTLQIDSRAVCLWMAFEGPLAATVVRKMGALLHVPLKQKALPSQTYLAKQIVQVVVRHSGTSNATYQLQHLMYGMLASQWGQPVAMDAMLSHEIAKVVDTLRAGKYKDNFSLQEMADISRVPMETFRKRFVSEVGMPPLSYVLHCKMERAKELLRDQNYSVREAGAEVGMKDPYHFSKQFKNIVGISPSAFVKQAADPNLPRTPRKREKHPPKADEAT
jgi:AraC-like DNA-binding protein